TVATEEPKESWQEYEQVFRSLGAPHVFHLDIEKRADARGGRAMRALSEAGAVFFTGGDQLKITSLVGDTPTYSRILEIFIAGGTTIVDGRHVCYTNVAEEQSDRTMSLFGVTTHLLSQGDRFDLKTREPTARPAQEIDDELGIGEDEESDK